jgi:tRNA dimethylallyltransferase
VLLVGGSGLYLRAVLGGLDDLPQDAALREALRERVAREGTEALHAELAERDPETAAVVSSADAQRITRALEIVMLSGEKASALRTRGRGAETPAALVVLDRSREDLEARIRARVAAMVEAGLESEVRALLARGLDPASPVLRSVGYAETVGHLNGELDRAAWLERIAINTRRFAKRQRTWFRGLAGARWLLVGVEEAPEATARRILEVWGAGNRSGTRG